MSAEGSTEGENRPYTFLVAASRLLAPAALLLYQLITPREALDPVERQTWTTSGPLDGFIGSLVTDPHQRGVIYAGTSNYRAPGTLWVSSDAGESWSNLGSASSAVRAIGVDPLASGRLFAAVQYDSFIVHRSWVYRSSNGGRSWTQLDLDDSFVHSFAFSAPPGVLFAAGSNGLLKTTDGGDSWTVVYNPTWGITAVVVDPSNASRVYAAGLGVSRSLDRGSTWENVSVGSAYVYSLAVAATQPALIFAGTDSGVFRSQDGGATWEPSSDGLPAHVVSSLAVDPRDETRVYAATQSGQIFTSSDSGQQWSLMPDQPANGGMVGPLAIDESGKILYAGVDDSVFVRSNPKPIPLHARP